MSWRVLCTVLVCVLATGAHRSYGETPQIQSRAALVIDTASGREILAKGADEVRGIASTTKLFVALVVRKKSIDLDAWTAINRVDVAAARGGARTRLDPGRKFTNRDLLRAMLIASDNRAPTALGRAVGLDQEGLVAAMNDLAKQLKLKKTKFVCASGLCSNESTARELAVALEAALEDSELRAIMSDEHHIVVSQDRRARIEYVTTNMPLAEGRFDVIGGKTGFTKAAGYCFATGARVTGRKLVMVFLGAERKATRFDDFNRVAAWLKANPSLLTQQRSATN
jgi:D-alanyl-D-alanine endopeptidase (penicillin-binding protein 7)